MLRNLLASAYRSLLRNKAPALLLAAITEGYRSLRAVLANPVDSLRSE